jgi:hypothetical protein
MNTAMIAHDHHETQPRPARSRTDSTQTVRRSDERLFRVLLWVSFPMCLLGVILTRIFPGLRSTEQGDTACASVFSEAVSSARSAIAIALNN